MGRSLSISIVNTRQWGWLSQCLDSLHAHPYTLGRFEILVLDNDSADGSVEKIRTQFPDVRLFPEARRRGFGANHNLLVARATGELILILNPDTVVHESTLDRLASAFDWADPVAIAAGPTNIPTPFRFPTPVASWKTAFGLHRLAGQVRAPDGPILLRDAWVSGSGFMIRREVFRQFGGFDEAFFIYGEETDLMRRLTQAGYVIAWVPDARIEHEGRTSEAGRHEPAQAARQGLSRTAVELVRGQARYMRKHHRKLGEFSFRAATAVDASLRLTASWLPGLSGQLQPKGPGLSWTRDYHLARLQAAAWPSRVQGIADAAHSWNRTHRSERQDTATFGEGRARSSHSSS